MSEPFTLYAITHSLYSGRARAYLIKNDIPFVERSTGHEAFKAEVLPLSKRPTIPTLVTPAGDVVRDGAQIIAHFEESSGWPNRPLGPRQQIVSALFDVIGAECLLRPAMHYRWNFPQDNLSFVQYHFYYSQRDLPTRQEKTEHMMNRMRHAAQFWGVTDETRDLVESLYLEFLQALNVHFETVPYLLGWRPCIGDFGLLAPLYAHLGRDPYPARLMQKRAVRVARWVERMNRRDQDVPEYFNAGDDFLENDAVPDTLLDVLRVVARDMLPETRAAADSINTWLADNMPESGTPVERMLGQITFEVEGQAITSMAQPYRFYQLQALHDAFDGMSEEAQSDVQDLLREVGMEELLRLRLDRQLAFKDNLEVWV